MKTVTLTFNIAIHANQRTIFSYISDWEKQSDWILFTTVKNLSNSINQSDANLLAITKFGPFKFVDTMVVTEWQPDEKIIVEHTGRVILGKGVFTVTKISADTCEFVWQEITPVPFGFVGMIGLATVKPLMHLLFNLSLRKLRDNIESI